MSVAVFNYKATIQAVYEELKKLGYTDVPSCWASFGTYLNSPTSNKTLLMNIQSPPSSGIMYLTIGVTEEDKPLIEKMPQFEKFVTEQELEDGL